MIWLRIKFIVHILVAITILSKVLIEVAMLVWIILLLEIWLHFHHGIVVRSNVIIFHRKLYWHMRLHPVIILLLSIRLLIIAHIFLIIIIILKLLIFPHWHRRVELPLLVIFIPRTDLICHLRKLLARILFICHWFLELIELLRILVLYHHILILEIHLKWL